MLLHETCIERLGLSAPGRVNLPVSFRPKTMQDEAEAGILSALAGICHAALLVAAILRRPGQRQKIPRDRHLADLARRWRLHPKLRQDIRHDAAIGLRKGSGRKGDQQRRKEGSDHNRSLSIKLPD